MRTRIPSRRAIVATVVGLVVSLSLVACSRISRPVADPPNEQASCSLKQFHGALVAHRGWVLLEPDWGNWEWPGIWALDWPGEWTVRPTDGEQLEVVEVLTGTVLARTGTRVILHTHDYLNPFNRDGAFIVCGPVTTL